MLFTSHISHFQNFFFKNSFHMVFFFCFSHALGLSVNKEDLLHITHCIISLLFFSKFIYIKVYFNMLCHWHRNICCLIWLHVDILTLFKRLLTDEEMPMQKVIMEKCLLHLTYGNNHNGVILIPCMVFF